MHNRVRAAGGAAIALLGLAGTLSGCASPGTGGVSSGSQPKMGAPSSSVGPSSPSLRGGPSIAVVELSSRFSPSTLRLGVGQQFELIIRKSVEVSGLNVAGCTSSKPVPLPGGLLSVQCKSSTDYMYSAEHAGTATLPAGVQPRCSAGTMCPQWMTRPILRVTISS